MSAAQPPSPRVASALPNRSGVGLKPEHIDEILARAAGAGIFRNPCGKLHGRRRPAASPAGGDPRALSAFPARRRPVDRIAKTARPRTSRASRRARQRAISRACFRSISPGPATTRAISTICCRFPIRRRRSPRSATTSIRCRKRWAGAMLLENPSTYVLFRGKHDRRDRFHPRDRQTHRLRPAARRQQRPGFGDQSRLRRRSPISTHFRSTMSAKSISPALPRPRTMPAISC